MLRDTRDVDLRGNVVLVTSDGLRLETTHLAWAAGEQRAWSNDPVTIYRGGIVARGQGFETRVKDEATTIKGRVRAVVAPSAARLPGKPS
jgi:LPS export ABC transporter protein LptC